MTKTFVSYGPNCEDVPLWRALKDVAQGFYIDFDSELADGTSVTRSFYDRGWCGLSIRETVKAATELAAARPRDTVITKAAAFKHDGIVAPDVHFVHISDRDNQTSILRSLDLSAIRPWIVVIEAGFEESDAVVELVGYQKVLFDGKNNFYLAPAHASRATRLAAPANSSDNFVRADASLRARVTVLEAQLTAAQTAVAGRTQRLLDAVRALGQARRDIELIAEGAAWLQGLLEINRDLETKLHAENAWLQNQLANLRENQLEQLVARTDEVVWLRGCLSQSEAKTKSAENAYAALLATRSKALPVQAARRLRTIVTELYRRPVPKDKTKPPSTIQPATRAQSRPMLSYQDTKTSPIELAAFSTPTSATSSADAPTLITRAPVISPITTVHQFHAGANQGDAITNSMLLIRSLLKKYGFESEIFAEHLGPGLEGRIHDVKTMPTGDDFFLIVHHSMGFGAFDAIVALPVQKGLIYHNITPPEFFAHLPKVQAALRLGQEQLAMWRDHVMFAFGDSDYNTTDLHSVGFRAVQTCPLLCDVDALLRRAAERKPANEDFTVLCVGRVTRSKAQLDLVAAFAAFRAMFDRPCRLVLVGSLDPDEYTYLEAIEGCITDEGLGGMVHFTGLASDDELHFWYGQADVYVSLSFHEGFCVPLVEAMAYEIPILAWPVGAIPQTLGHAGTLLASRDPNKVAMAMLAVATRSFEEADSARALEKESLKRFAPERALTILLKALTEAGVQSPESMIAAQEQTVRAG